MAKIFVTEGHDFWVRLVLTVTAESAASAIAWRFITLTSAVMREISVLHEAMSSVMPERRGGGVSALAGRKEGTGARGHPGFQERAELVTASSPTPVLPRSRTPF